MRQKEVSWYIIYFFN